MVNNIHNLRGEGTFEGTFWTIQHKHICNGKCYDNEYIESYWHDWNDSSFDSIASPASEYENSWQTFGAKGFLTKELGLMGLANVRAHSPNASTHQFRLVEIYIKKSVMPVAEGKKR